MDLVFIDQLAEYLHGFLVVVVVHEFHSLLDLGIYILRVFVDGDIKEGLLVDYFPGGADLLGGHGHPRLGQTLGLVLGRHHVHAWLGVGVAWATWSASHGRNVALGRVTKH